MRTGERSNRLRQPCALLVCFAGHDCGDRAAERPAFYAIITETVAHNKRAKVRVAKSQCPENMRILRDFFYGVTCVVHDDFLRGDENAHGRLESLDTKVAVRSLELHQVERRKIAGCVIEKKIFRAG